MDAVTGGRGPSKKVRMGIELLVSGKAGSVGEAAAKAGLARETLSRQMNKPSGRAEINAQIARRMGGAVLAKASGAIEQLISRAASEHVRLDASKFILAMSGYASGGPSPVNVSVNMMPAGYVIDLSEPSDHERTVIGAGPAGGVIIDVEPND